MSGPMLAGTRPHVDDELHAPLGRDLEAACVTGNKTARWTIPPRETPECRERASSRRGQHWGTRRYFHGQRGCGSKATLLVSIHQSSGAPAAHAGHQPGHQTQKEH
jgi:hypothetical protein